ncbi:hypothetical protein [Methylobacterium sp. Leaf118]|uniref:hypothetical protein n=1 Tax=Methylobacterium sp. Leaf118 TaxID=2876562 RepID=UPI001E55370A|nr:hypothetical protein [Methylobacterium sp. Leaf118]
MHPRTMMVACAVTLLPTAASAESWTVARGGSARYGLISEVCRTVGDVPTCLALACRGGALDLVSVAGGGGPMEGKTTLRFGERSAHVSFVYDPKAVDRMGIAAARARVSSGLIDALARADRVELSTSGAGERYAHRFTLRGLSQHVSRARAACPDGRSPAR